MSTLSAIILLFGYRTSTGGTAATAPLMSATASPSGPTSTSNGSAGSSGSGSGSSGSGSSGSGSSGSGSAGSSSSSGARAAKTYDGAVTGTRWGDVQVQITVSAGKITAVRVLQVPSGNSRDQEINDQAVPILNQEVLSAQSANIDTVSGATVTSDGYITSLQAALDQAGL
ncbi:MAG: FMN-binding protein [bacterium]